MYLSLKSLIAGSKKTIEKELDSVGLVIFLPLVTLTFSNTATAADPMINLNIQELN